MTIDAQLAVDSGEYDPQLSKLMAMYSELGVNSPYHALPVDPNAMLYPRINALRTYEKMKRNDAQVRNSLKVCKYAILGGEWFVKPASDSDKDREIAEFIEFNLFENMSYTWLECLNHLLTYMDYGFSIGEIVWDIGQWRSASKNSNSRQMTLLRKIAPRPAVTIDKFVYDSNGGPAGVEHRIVDPNGNGDGQPPDPVFIPIEKLVVLTHDKEGGDMEGMSILRTAYLHWYFKHKLYDIDAIQKERHGMGVPDVELPPSYTDQDLTVAAKMAQSLRTNQRGFILRPQGFVVGFAKVEGQLTDALRSAEHHDVQIARNVLVQFINGNEGGSSRANTATAYDLFEKVQRGNGGYVCDTVNKYVIKQLVDKNFDVTRYPKLQVRGIGSARDVQQFSSAIRNLVQVDALSIDDDFETFIRRTLDLPEIWDKDNVRVNEALLKPFTSPTGDPNDVVQGGGNQGSASAAGAAAQRAPSPKASGLGAKPTGGRGPTTGNTGKGPTQNQ